MQRLLFPLLVLAVVTIGSVAAVAIPREITAISAHKWLELSPAGGPPQARAGHAAVWDKANNQLLVSGGHPDLGLGSDLDDLWAYDSATNVWSQKAFGPSSRNGHCAVWDSQSNRMLVFGGAFVGTLYNDLWSYDPVGNSWQQLTPTGGPPPARDGHACVWDEQNDEMLVFGGRIAGGVLTNDLWAYSPTTDDWVQLSDLPDGGRWLHSAVWDKASVGMLVFGGGVDGVGLVDELWFYSPGSDSWSQLTPIGPSPQARAAHSAVYGAIPIQDTLVLCMVAFGGSGTSGKLNDVWLYCPWDNSWAELSPSGALPAPREYHVAVWDDGGFRMLVFGGDGSRLDDLWAFVPDHSGIIGGIAELPALADRPAAASGSSDGGYGALAAPVAVAVGAIALSAGGFYVRRRWLR